MAALEEDDDPPGVAIGRDDFAMLARIADIMRQATFAPAANKDPGFHSGCMLLVEVCSKLSGPRLVDAYGLRRLSLPECDALTSAAWASLFASHLAIAKGAE